jgi:hypothetical protein
LRRWSRTSRGYFVHYPSCNGFAKRAHRLRDGIAARTLSGTYECADGK